MSPLAFSRIRREFRRQKGRRQRRISAILRSFSNRRSATDPTIQDLSLAFDTRAFGAFFILFGSLNLVPLPPGASTVFGLPLILFALQLAVGRHRVWLPERVRTIRLKPETLASLMTKVGPLIRRAERLARHRMWPQPEGLLLCVVGWICLFLAVIVAIPFPLTNMAPGVAIAIAGIAITARDGLWLIAAAVLGAASVLFLIGVYGGAVLALVHML
ncbi:exopolysaccharide biosynthesis protein [Fulvimarina sp. 2208YS6-2-32]|uniref:Exopolysaccharide biosynthesis protein n=1 Tax=Fulvimarina uroteuthidis TaxID=3098149 RepID=A0ABU5I763_9HYPH|nr:exopolysaccharide biosynthesis protein [Fulvimarina sp. 2208YS6-2-32]MDY8109986.1 exopolysaccharide biosynthesis protein [Fulvimarina sp. 2208YS6-2-32]